MIVLQAGWVVPVEGPPVKGGAVAVEGGRVRAVGGRGDLEREAEEVRDLGPGVLLPGLVNAHAHVELSHLAGALDGARGDGFVGWVEALVARRPADPPAAVTAAAAKAIRAIEESGTVAVGDVSNSLLPVPLLAASRLRAVVFHELLAWDPETAPRALEAARARQVEVGGARPSANVEVRLAAHAPYSVSARLFEILRAEAGGAAALHLAESPAEVEFLATGGGPWPSFLERRGLGHVRFEPPRLSPVAYADALRVLRPGLVAAHGVHADADDRRLLGERGVFVALCPRSNRNLGVGTARVPELMADGVRLCLGTDSLASVDTLDLVDDMVELRRTFPGLDPGTIVALATAGGASALGFADLGTIAPGQSAALAFAPGEAGLRDPNGFLVSGEARLRRVSS